MTVTAILPFHDSDYIGEAVASVHEQTRPPEELILVADKAPQSAIDRADAAVDGSIPTTLIRRETDSGDFPKPTNEAAMAAEGDLYAFLFHDDRWCPEYLERQVDAFEAHPPGVGLQWTGEYHIDADGERTGQDVVCWPAVERWSMFLTCWVPSPSACVVRARHFHAIDGFDPDMLPLADWDFYWRMWQAAALRSIDEPLMEFRRHAGQQFAEAWATVNEYRGKFIEKHAGLLKRAGFYEQALDRHRHLCLQETAPGAP